MNERILELMTKAGFDVEKLRMYPGGCPREDLLVLQDFAELIVRQCGYYADVFESAGCPVDMDPTETKPSDYIKKNFGVEE